MGENTGLSDANLIGRCLNSDPDAWETLIRRYQRLIASITFKYRLSAEDAADILQSVFMTLHQQLPSLKNQEKLSSWLITVTVRECWKFRKRQILTDSIDSQDDDATSEIEDQSHISSDESLMLIEKQQTLRRAVEMLPEPCRGLIEHLFYRDEPSSYAVISAKLGMPVASIGPTRSRCLEKLKSSLKKSDFF